MALSIDTIQPGQSVRAWFDTGAFGMTFIYGRVLSKGAVFVTVHWHTSDRRQRIHRDRVHLLEQAEPDEMDEVTTTERAAGAREDDR